MTGSNGLFSVQEEARDRFQGLKISRQAPSISHLFFADDTFLFCKANRSTAEALKEILDSYEKASGQQVNNEKSSIVMSRNTREGIRNEISAILHFQEVHQHDQYLGMPVQVGKSRKEIFRYIKDRVWKRIQGWGERKLSIAGKQLLIKAVIQAIPTYVMSCFLLPKTFLQELCSLTRRFWWGSGQRRGICWLNWATCCKAKRSGGLGFRDLHVFNRALLAKQGWRILNNPASLLSRLLKAKYHPNSDFLHAKLGSRPTVTWRSILSGRELLAKGLIWQVRSGTSVRIWNDPWLEALPGFKPITPCPSGAENRTVSELLDPGSGEWKEETIRDILWPVDAEQVLGTRINSHRGEDKLIWTQTASGIFTVRSCYHLGFDIPTKNSSRENSRMTDVGFKWNCIWTTQVPNKVKNFLWRMAWNILPTREQLLTRRIMTTAECPMCHKWLEDAYHALVACSFAQQVWLFSGLGIDIPAVHFVNFPQWLVEVHRNLGTEGFELFAVLCRAIWINRNNRVFSGTSVSAMEVASRARCWLNEFKMCRVMTVDELLESS